MLVVLPVCSKDIHLAARSVEHCFTLDGRCDYPALIAHERGDDIATLEDLCRRYFITTDVFTYDRWTGDPSWPHPQNYAWQTIARHIESKRPNLPWLWWEPDAIPLKPGWLQTLYTAYTQGDRPFAGPVATQLGNTYIAGVSIYPPNISAYCNIALLTRTQPWDIVASTRDGTIRKAHDLSALIHHTPLVTNTCFSCTDDITREIPESAVLFHKCKDGSLLDVLQGRITDISTPRPATTYNTTPSFTEQTPWPCGYFTFPAATNTAHFNPTIIDANGSLHLMTRRWRYNLEQITSGAMHGNRSDLAIWRVRPNMTLHPTPLLPTLPMRYPNEQWEDPRAMLGEDGQVYLSMATWTNTRNWAIRQSFARLSPDFRKVEPLFEAPYGGNERRPTESNRHEKNWIWFQRDGHWHCQYSINPGDVFRVDSQGNPIETWQTKEARHDWTTGLPLRGGTPPTLVNDEYIAFFHTAVPWQKPKRRYFMGAYTFDATPPFALRRITPIPLLIGSESDFRSLGGPLVIFPGGAILSNNEWLIVFGVNDEACGWIRIPHDALESRLTPVKRGVMERLSLAMA